jgi:hypothetical protein
MLHVNFEELHACTFEFLPLKIFKYFKMPCKPSSEQLGIYNFIKLVCLSASIFFIRILIKGEPVV